MIHKSRRNTKDHSKTRIKKKNGKMFNFGKPHKKKTTILKKSEFEISTKDLYKGIPEDISMCKVHHRINELLCLDTMVIKKSPEKLSNFLIFSIFLTLLRS